MELSDVDPANYFLPMGYVSRGAPSYFNHQEADLELIWQPDVYADAAHIARRIGAACIIDLGCGDGNKLVRLHPEFELVGIDIGPNLEACRARYPFGTWVEHDLETPGGLTVRGDALSSAVLVCADVIEHLVRPERLLQKLKGALAVARAAVLTTPERELTWGVDHRGPPPNSCHVREWSREEFARLLAQTGFEHVQVGLTRSSDRDPGLKTIEALCFPNRRTQRRAARPSAATCRLT